MKVEVERSRQQGLPCDSYRQEEQSDKMLPLTSTLLNVYREQTVDVSRVRHGWCISAVGMVM